MPDKIYKNAPLLEVICELRWTLQQLPAAPHVQHDPFFSDLLDAIKPAAIERGFSHLEILQPEDVPREVRPFVVDHRFRRAKNTWPLFQIGPGVFTVNAVPPYGGWTSLRTILTECLSLLHDCYPLAEKYLRISRLELRYLNAFDQQKYGTSSSHQFFSKYFNIKASIPTNFLDNFVDPADQQDSDVTVTTPLAHPAGSVARLAMSKGTNRGVPAFIADNAVRFDTQTPKPSSPDALTSWFDRAHQVTSATFAQAVTDELRDNFLPLTDVGD